MVRARLTAVRVLPSDTAALVTRTDRSILPFLIRKSFVLRVRYCSPGAELGAERATSLASWSTGSPAFAESLWVTDSALASCRMLWSGFLPEGDFVRGSLRVSFSALLIA